MMIRDTDVLTADRSSLADDLVSILPTHWTVWDHEPEQIRPPAATISPAPSWITYRDDCTTNEVAVAWTIRLIVEPGPSADVSDRLCQAISTIIAARAAWRVEDVSEPVTLIVSDAQAFPAAQITVTNIIERT